MKVLITNIQRFCVHDGAGIRTTVFLKGCSLHCPWCANPENLTIKQNFKFVKNKCIKRDNHCFINPDCPLLKGENVVFDEASAHKCLAEAVIPMGKYYTTEDLYRELIRDKVFWGDEGGVTFSGGEALLQIDALIPLLQKLKSDNINTSVETALCVPHQFVEKAVGHIDHFIVDMKVVEKQTGADKLLGIDVDKYLDNLQYVVNQIGKDKITVRVPLVGGITNTKGNIAAIKQALEELEIGEVEIFSVHNLAKSKYEELSLLFKEHQVIPEEELKKIRDCLSSDVTNVKVIKI